MTHVAIAISITDPSELDQALQRVQMARNNGAKLVEWRVDALAEQENAAAMIARLVRDSALPSIVTIRSETEGGLYGGTEANRANVLATLLEGDDAPRYIDVEWESMRRPDELRAAIAAALDSKANADRRTSVIASAHSFEGRPPNMLQMIELATLDDRIDVIKLAWFARSLRDNLEAIDVLAERRKPTIALCMGPFGLMSRVLAPKFGGLVTYASGAAGEGTAPGQPTVEDLFERYRFASINESTRVFGVIGWPIEHSQSPAIHNAGFEAIGYDGVYLPMPVPGDATEVEHFNATVGALIDHDRLDFRGASVTIPHKENLVKFIRERGGRLDAASGRVNAANTLIVGSAGGLSCANTDVPAAIQSLCAGMQIEERDLKGRPIAVIGAGGVARAVIAGLIDAGAEVVVFNRTVQRTRDLIDDLESRGSAPLGSAVVGKVGGAAQRFDAVVNCTSIGMEGGPAPEASPIDTVCDGKIMVDDGVTVMDTVYAPVQTPLLGAAEQAGANTIGGWDMFMRQAALQFELWTGKQLPTGETSFSV